MKNTSTTNQHKIDSLQVKQTATILEAMKALDNGAAQIALVVDEQKKLYGVITDGDLRRAILGGADLNSQILPIANTTFRSVLRETSRTAALDLMKCFSIEQLPILDEDGFVHGMHLLNELIQVKTLPNAAMILAGGKGTRLGKLTEATPKPMIKVAGRPILERIVLHLIGGGVRNIFLSVNYLAEQIESHFGDGSQFGCQIHYLLEETPLGTGGPLALLSEHGIDAPVIVMNGDLVADFDVQGIFDTHETDANSATIGVKNYRHQVPFGCLRVEDGRVLQLVEKPTLQQTINAGIYVISPSLVNSVKPEFTPITSLIESAIDQDLRVGTFQIDDWLDVGQPAQLAEARGTSQ